MPRKDEEDSKKPASVFRVKTADIAGSAPTITASELKFFHMKKRATGPAINGSTPMPNLGHH